MSLRYCWERYVLETNYTLRYGDEDTEGANSINTGSYSVRSTVYVAKSITVNSDGEFVGVDEVRAFSDDFYDGVNYYSNYRPADYPYMFPSGQSPSNVCYYALSGRNVAYYAVTANVTTNRVDYRRYNSGTSPGLMVPVYVDHQQAQGSLIGQIIGNTQSQYPTNGISGDYWYIYQGSDSIDPTAITAPATIRLGKPITVTISPSTSKVYGGNVSYRYQVNRNGSGWADVQASTPNTSISYQVPLGTTSLQFRVQASDDLGFTSTDWITSDQIEVIQLSENAHMLHVKKDDGTYENMWLETDTEIVLRPDGTTLKDTLANIESRLSGLGV